LRMPMFRRGQRRIKTPAWRGENGILIRLTTTTTAFRNWRGLGSDGAQYRVHHRQSVVVAARVVSTRNPELFFLVLRLLFSWPNVLQLRQLDPKP
jgi:hypothetical protein